MNRQESVGTNEPRGLGATVARDDQIELGGLWSAIKRRKWWVILPTLATAAAATAFSLLATPRYSADARVLLEIRDTELTQIGRTGARDTSTIDNEAVLSQVQVVTSYDLARLAIRKLGLVGNAEFDPAASGLGVLQRILMMIGLAKVPGERESEDRILETYYNRLLVFPVGKSRVLSIEFTSLDRELAARAANTISDLYVESLATAKQGVAKSAGSWLSSAIDPLRERVREAEAKVEVFRGRSGLLISTNNATLLQQQLSDTSIQLSAARSAKAEADAKVKQIREALKQNRVFELSEVVNNETIRRLIEQRGTLRAQIANESRNLLPEHPQIKSLRAQLADIETQVRAAADRTIRTIESDGRITGARVESLAAALEEQKTRLAESNGAEVQLRALEREAKTLREQLETYLTRFREASTRDLDNSAPPDARVISRAVVPQKPTFPKPVPIILIATLCALGVTMSLVTVRELATPRGDGGPAPLSEFEETAVLTPPALAAADAVLATLDAGSEPVRPTGVTIPAVADTAALAALAEKIAEGLGHDGSLAICVVAQPREAAIGVELARSLAAGTRALLLLLHDPDPGLAPDGGGDGAGLVELVAGRASFTEVIRREPNSRLHWIGPGQGPVEAASEDVVTLELVLEALAATYEAIIVSAPSETADVLARLVTKRMDAVVIVGAGENPDAATERAFERFGELSGREPYVLLVGGKPAPIPGVTSEQEGVRAVA